MQGTETYSDNDSVFDISEVSVCLYVVCVCVSSGSVLLHCHYRVSQQLLTHLLSLVPGGDQRAVGTDEV